MQKEEKILRIKLALFSGTGPRTLHMILENYQGIAQLQEAYKKGRCKEMIKGKLRYFLDTVDEIDTRKFLEKVEKSGLKFVVFGEDSYPYNLAHIYEPPIILFYKGDISLCQNFSKLISIVGTRGYSIYGKLATEWFIEALAAHDFIIVSGMAYGIDAIAHRAALKYKARTIAVLASSAHEPTPAGNEDLYCKILENGGLVVSETMPGDSFRAHDFPRRNRIIAGISRGVIVTEAGERSGALITAHQAFQENREVYAVPAEISTKRLQGTNKIIYLEKAKLIFSPKCLLEQLGVVKWDEKMKRKDFEFSSFQKKIADQVKKNPKTIDDLVKIFDNDYGILLASLTEMEIKSVLKQDEAGRYIYIY
ncbi:DNA-processing protein DprA [Candidatus Dojkabacteria bacterium]|nr:DNA-processing protein DprA [Candidatus Dojkabacteria bacterium]